MTNLEKNLIHPDLWIYLYNNMPEECKAIVEASDDVVGIGLNNKNGWYILFAGQGPYLAWSEHENM